MGASQGRLGVECSRYLGSPSPPPHTPAPGTGRCWDRGGGGGGGVSALPAPQVEGARLPVSRAGSRQKHRQGALHAEELKRETVLVCEEGRTDLCLTRATVTSCCERGREREREVVS